MSSIADIFHGFIGNWASKEELYLKIGTASEIDENDFTFKFTPLDEKSVVETVRMKVIVDGSDESMVLIPKENTKVVVAFHSNTVGQCLKVQEVSKIFINSDSKTTTIANDYNILCDDVKVTTESWVFNGGVFEGLIKIVDFTTKLNDLIDEVDVFKDKFNNHLHTGVTTGGGVSGIKDVADVTAFSPFNKADYENTKIKH